MIHNLKYTDNRGDLIFPIKNNNILFSECTISINKKDVFRGIHINNFDKLVTCIQGKILDIIINFNENEEDYLIPKYFELDPKTDLFQIFVPKNYGHSFLSLEENSILVYHFTDKFTDENTKHIHYKDPFIELKLPIQNIILSEKDNIKNFYKPIDYLLFGSTGYLGSNVEKYLKLENKNYIKTNLRLQEVHEIRKILYLYRPKYVICCSGITGTPNIFWCDHHKIETIETNITYQLTLAHICKEFDIHLTIFGSGGIFDNNNIYTEKSDGNFYNNFYSTARIYLENIIKNYENVLYLRINYPISNNKSDKNLLTKLLKYKTIDLIEISVTYIDNLIPILFKMIEQKENGICNFTNPGIINLTKILDIYNDYNKSKIEYIINNSATINSRSLSKLECGKLNKYNPLNIEDSIKLCVQHYLL